MLVLQGATQGGSTQRVFSLWGAVVWAALLMLWVSVCQVCGQLTEEDQMAIVVLHNRYRGEVAPSASYMRQMKWDVNLKLLAESYAVKCEWKHNPNLPDDAGENLYAATGTLNVSTALRKWYQEHEHYDYNNNTCQDDKMCGHYTQMVWEDSEAVGCAAHRCDTMEGLAFEKATFLVCNYYPAGNYEGEKPYQEGEWCSMCPEDLQRCHSNLCVSDAPQPSEEPGGDDNDEDEGTNSPTPGTNGPYTHTATEDDLYIPIGSQEPELKSAQPDQPDQPWTSAPTMEDPGVRGEDRGERGGKERGGNREKDGGDISTGPLLVISLLVCLSLGL